MYKVTYLKEAKKDILNLPSDVLKEVREYLIKYETNPYKYSQALYNQGNLDLSTCRKTYVANAKYRIVIQIEENIAKIVQVIATGKRENKEVYKIAHKRINK